MSLSVITTVEDPSANSYVAVADVTAYAPATIWNDAWTTAASTPDLQASYVLRAARALDGMVFPGYPTVITQGMQWPRSMAVRMDGALWDPDVVPVQIQRAQCHLAAWLAGQGSTTDPFDVDPTAKFVSQRVDVLSTTYVPSIGPDGRRFLDTVIGPLLRPWGLLAPQGSARLVR